MTQAHKGQGDNGSAAPLDDLEVFEELGRGGYGTVFRAQWKGQQAAVKVGALAGGRRSGHTVAPAPTPARPPALS